MVAIKYVKSNFDICLANLWFSSHCPIWLFLVRKINITFMWVDMFNGRVAQLSLKIRLKFARFCKILGPKMDLNKKINKLV